MNDQIVKTVLFLAVCIAIVLFTLWSNRKHQTGIQEIWEDGRIVIAKVIRIDERTERTDKLRFAKRYYVSAEWIDPQTMKTYSFLSDPLIDVPANINPGGSVKVRINPHNPNRYIVDIVPITSSLSA